METQVREILERKRKREDCISLCVPITAHLVGSYLARVPQLAKREGNDPAFTFAVHNAVVLVVFHSLPSHIQ